MNFYKFLLVLTLWSGVGLKAQVVEDLPVPTSLKNFPQSELQKDEYGNYYYYDKAQRAKIYDINGEQVIVMDELMVKSNPKFNNQLDRNFYFFLNKKLNRVYPLFLDALSQYNDIQNNIQAMQGNEKRQYIKQKQEALAKDYEAKLKDLTTTEGQVFSKLMNRATGKTVYQIIKELRGGWSAFWWNVKGNMADVPLKAEYNPHLIREDLFIESLLQKNWTYGYFKPYPGYENFKVKK